MINVFQPCLGEEEVSRIREVFQSNWLGKGKLVDEFEEKYAAHLDTDKSHILTANCCSEGLFSSMHLFGIGEGDEVIVPTISFVGAGNAVFAAGAKLVLTDVDPRTLNIRPEDILAHITPRTKAILLLHFGGIPCDMDPIMEIAREHHLTVIEDSACGIYSRYKGKPLGTIGDMGMWSFDAMKILVCADGSALYFKDPAVREKAAKWLYFGLESKSGYSNSVDKKWWEYDLSCFGHRSIMNDVTAAMALEQLKKLPGFIARRHEIAAIYDSRLAGLDWLDLPPALPADCSGTYYFYHVQTKRGSRDDLAKFLRDNDVYTTFRYFPLHRVPAYGLAGSFPNADYAADHTLCLPIHQALTDDEVNYICDKIIEFGKNNNL